MHGVKKSTRLDYVWINFLISLLLALKSGSIKYQVVRIHIPEGNACGGADFAMTLPTLTGHLKTRRPRRTVVVV
jgi:hypothetical protein